MKILFTQQKKSVDSQVIENSEFGVNGSLHPIQPQHDNAFDDDISKPTTDKNYQKQLHFFLHLFKLT